MASARETRLEQSDQIQGNVPPRPYTNIACSGRPTALLASDEKASAMRGRFLALNYVPYCGVFTCPVWRNDRQAMAATEVAKSFASGGQMSPNRNNMVGD